VNRRPLLAFTLGALWLAATPLSAAAPVDDDWIATWTASPQAVWGPDFPAPVKVPRNLWAQTVRQVARVSIGGRRVRVVLSNEFSEWPFEVGAAQVALRAVRGDDGGRATPRGRAQVRGRSTARPPRHNRYLAARCGMVQR